MSKKKPGKSKKIKSSSSNLKSTSKKGLVNRSTIFSLGIILGIIAFLIYSNTLSHEYTLDDYSAIKENFVTKKGVAGLGDIFTKHYRYGYWNSPGTLYRPMSLAMFAVEWQIAEDSPGFYHFMNVLLYAFTAFFLFWTLVKLLPEKGLLIPFLTTLIFVAHPLHVEVVANIKSRDEILSFLFCIGAIYSFWKYLKFDNIKWLFIALGAYTIAMFSKESAITFLAVYPLIGYFFLKKDIPSSITKSIPFIAPVAFYLLVRKAVLGSMFAGASDVPVLDNAIASASGKGEELSTAFLFAGKYLKNLFVPYPLGSDFGYPEFIPTGWGDWRVLVTFLLFAGAGVFALLNFRKRSLWSFSILYFLITFSIFSNMIILIGTSYGDRLMYVPSLGFALALAYAIVLVSKVNPEDLKYKIKSLSDFFKKYTMPLAIGGVIALVFSAMTIMRNPVWENSFTLYDADIKVAPNSAKLNYHYGLELNKKGIAATDPNTKGQFWDQAMFRFNRALELYPNYSDAYGQRGLMYYRLKDFPKALADYKQAISLKPKATVYSNMGTIYFETGKVNEAINAYKLAVKYDPKFVDARRNLGSAYARTQQFDLALKEFQEALKYEPNDPIIHFYMGSVYRDKGDITNSKIWLEKAYQLDPGLRK